LRGWGCDESIRGGQKKHDIPTCMVEWVESHAKEKSGKTSKKHVEGKGFGPIWKQEKEGAGNLNEGGKEIEERGKRSPVFNGDPRKPIR